MIGLLETAASWRAALARWAGRTLDIIVHLGAHRTATTTFQQFTMRNAGALRPDGIARLAGSDNELTAEITRSGEDTGATPPVPLPAEGQVYGKQNFMV